MSFPKEYRELYIGGRQIIFTGEPSVMLIDGVKVDIEKLPPELLSAIEKALTPSIAGESDQPQRDYVSGRRMEGGRPYRF